MMNRVKKHFPGETWDEYYRRYQTVLAEAYLIPILRRWQVDLDDRKVLEVGCGDGGCGAALARAGGQVYSMDIDERLVKIAAVFNQQEGLNIPVLQGDVSDKDSPVFRDRPFDIILLRDVVEHLPDLVKVLGILRRQLSSNGVLFIVFPPYYSPYGAHQQILPRRNIGPVPVNKLPFVQLLPDRLFFSLIKGDGPAHREVRSLRNIRLTLRKFKAQAQAAGLTICKSKQYLSRPTFNLRYGLPVVGASIFGRVPLLNELMVTAGYYLLKIAENTDGSDER
jgi:protein-L-isoaspartate O-methyltransferase